MLLTPLKQSALAPSLTPSLALVPSCAPHANATTTPQLHRISSNELEQRLRQRPNFHKNMPYVRAGVVARLGLWPP